MNADDGKGLEKIIEGLVNKKNLGEKPVEVIESIATNDQLSSKKRYDNLPEYVSGGW